MQKRALAGMDAVERVAVGQEVYYMHPLSGWLRGKVTGLPAGDKVHVLDANSGHIEIVPKTDVHAFIEDSYDSHDDDLFHVGDLHVATLLYCIKDRFEKLHKQYSLMGEMILSVNPFQLMPFNSDEERAKYLRSPEPQKLTPHIWQVAHKAFAQIIVRGLGNQSVLISGESGSGKTENTKMLVAYLGQLSYQHSCNAMQRSIADKIAECLYWSNPVLESFGNARTVRNDNSSRFGKYTKLYFEVNSGVMVGGETETYLLEKSRIISQSAGERNYHIFYDMLAGLTPQEKAELGNLRTARDYRCLNGGNTFERRGVDGRTLNDATQFEEVKQAFSKLGVDAATQMSIFKVLASILHLTEVKFATDNNDKARIVDMGPVKIACKLLGVSVEKLTVCFLEKSRTKILTLLASKEEAEGLRNAFCKALYLGIFDKIVEMVNKAIEPTGNVKEYKYIGLLDIFGFENFDRNSFEQLCINYANESLQNHYNKYTFINDEEECRSEGIQIPEIVFPDNSVCVNMFDRRPDGLFGILDEESNFKGSTQERLTLHLWNVWGGGKCQYFAQPKSTIATQFGVNHYASYVHYHTNEWLEKNADAVKAEAYECVASSTDPFISSSLVTNDSSGGPRARQTVAGRFQKQLVALRAELESTETQFIRCIKPNVLAAGGVLENLLVSHQLESAGVLQTIALKRQGYPVRRLLPNFCKYFYPIIPASTLEAFKKQDYRECTKQFLTLFMRLYGWPTPNYAVGKSKVFLRANVWSSLERLLLRRKRAMLRQCLPYLSEWVARYREKKRIEEERRREQLRKMQEEAAARRERERQATIEQDGKMSGLIGEKLRSFEELAVLFPLFDYPVILDVVNYLPTREQALVALTEMQQQRLDVTIPATLTRLFSEVGVRQSVIERIVTAGVDTVAKLSELDAEQLEGFGMSPDEIRGMQQKMLRQQSMLVSYERLATSIGTNNNVLESVLDVKEMVQKNRADGEGKVRRLMEMGFSRKLAVTALERYGGDLDRATARLLKHSARHPPRNHDHCPTVDISAL